MTKRECDELWKKLHDTTEKIFKDAPSCHDMSHTLRVIKNAELLLKSEKDADPFIVRTAALLHDTARPDELTAGTKVCHAALGAEKSKKILRECGCTDEKFIANVSECVRTHRYRGRDIPKNIEAMIVYDADKLDSLGAFGIARAFHFAGRIGACLHNTAEDALSSEAYSKEDSAYREYLVKLRNLPFKLMTPTARKLGEERAIYMRDFFERMNNGQ